ncbi:sushi, von Willebrand factor type A, EGF and pentraxin domain-containing protein 1-like isoform X2 [Hydractinia symbiolongicarpus]|uniref:sushi, von Willebrand factor type A, EGF and pentraxin domain-containing protein 1-like isoform X2 n=1 Tax=Hydractinia symbiolongicarpus TaxID=13093 RepID=UPI00254C5D7E|nr:sushi, von Willebrand factor type A, EGF and pentraxin domain-containing protein 1-like isoform X2 [Hydractinia symbiolongicarpus]
MRNKMSCLIFAILFFIIRHSDAGCLSIKCEIKYSEFKPQPSAGRCCQQQSKVRYYYTTKVLPGNCHAPILCKGKDKYRYWCSCKQIRHCWWASWQAWTGSVSHGKCGTQRRYRKGEKSYTYAGKESNCNGVVTKCPRDIDEERRTWCNCRKAETCTSGQWTGWSPSVNNGKCLKQLRYQDKIPKYRYIQQQSNCFGINPNCPPRITDSRTFCRCPYKECIEGSWTAWELHSWTGNCPTERRLKKYRSITKYKDSYGNCQGIGPQSCPDPVGATREKEITCAKLPVPVNGAHMNPACDGVNSKCKAICQISCNKTFILEGNRYLTCQGDGKWSGVQGKCKDAQPPVITCPIIHPFNNTPNENYGIVDLPDATATDNTGLKPTITMDKTSPLKVFINSPVKVRYTATDDSGNSKSCEVTIEVKDTEPPKVVSCPHDKVFQTGKVPMQVFWGEPQFYDNADKDNVNVHPSHVNGDNFQRGKHLITYLARDKALNYVKCTFSIQVELMQCPVYDPPKHGSASCNIRKDGVVETHICTVSCKQDTWFMKGPNIPTLYHYYVCGEHGQWRGQNTFNPTSPTNFVPIPKGQTPWPDCAIGNAPDGVTMEFQVFGSSCKDNTDKLKKDFIAAMKNDIIINNLYCLSSATHCVIENFVVYCATKKKRSTGGSTNQVVIKFTLAVRDKKPSTQKLEMKKLNAMTQSLNNQKSMLLDKVKKVAPSLLKATATVDARNAEISCKPGYEYKIVDGNQDASERTKCLKCPRGTYYDQKTKQCAVCKVGYYQENEASLSCKKCPTKTSTHGSLSHDYHQCRAICQPGTYSSTGLATCLACPMSTYQPLENSTSCIACPSGKVTSHIGSTSIQQCSQPGVDVVIHSEGFGDPGKTGLNGVSTITVNGQDYSPHKRGFNFVVLDAFTGKFLQANAFDWHGDYGSCGKTYNWISNLKDEVIVLAAIQDEATSAAHYVECFKALEIIGGKRPFQTEYRSSFALIGYKGKRVVDWVKQKKSYFGRGPTGLKDSIKLLK